MLSQSNCFYKKMESLQIHFQHQRQNKFSCQVLPETLMRYYVILFKLLRNHYVIKPEISLLDDTFYPMSGQTTVGAGLENALKRLSLNQDWANGKSLHRTKQ